MIRFVYIGDQITCGSEEFAFFDTGTDTIMDFDGKQVFSSIEDFDLFAKDSEYYTRCKGLIPKSYNKHSEWTVDSLQRYFEDETTWFDNKCHSLAVSLVGKNSKGLLSRLLKANPNDYLLEEDKED